MQRLVKDLNNLLRIVLGNSYIPSLKMYHEEIKRYKASLCSL